MFIQGASGGGGGKGGGEVPAVRGGKVPCGNQVLLNLGNIILSGDVS